MPRRIIDLNMDSVDLPRFDGRRVLRVLGILLFVMYLLIGCTNVPVGSNLVIFNRFTHGFGPVREPGLTWVEPISSSRQEYNTRTQAIHFTSDQHTEGPDRPIPALSKDALGLMVDLSVQYHLKPDGLVDLHQEIGPDFKTKIVVPAVRETVRDIIARHTATNAATSDREQIKKEMEAMLGPLLASRDIVLEQVLLRDLHLPDQVVQAINAKITAQQDSEKMVYVLAKAEQEKEKIKIEAQAQAERIAIIDQALAANPNYLNWLAIDKLNDNVNLIISDGKTILNLDGMKARGTTDLASE